MRSDRSIIALRQMRAERSQALRSAEAELLAASTQVTLAQSRVHTLSEDVRVLRVELDNIAGLLEEK